MFFRGIEEWIQILFIGLVILGYVVRLFRQAFHRPPDAGAPPAQEAPAPAQEQPGRGNKDIRQFLDEIRRGIEEAQAEATRTTTAEPARPGRPEVARRDESPPAASVPPPLPTLSPATVPPRREGSRRRRRELHREAPAVEAPPAGVESVHEYLERLREGGEAGLATAASAVQQSAFHGGPARLRAINVTLREAMLAEVILGPPRARRGRRPPRRGS